MSQEAVQNLKGFPLWGCKVVRALEAADCVFPFSSFLVYHVNYPIA